MKKPLTKTERAALEDLFEYVLENMPRTGEILSVPLVMIWHAQPTMQLRYLRQGIRWLEDKGGYRLDGAMSAEHIREIILRGLKALVAEGQAGDGD